MDNETVEITFFEDNIRAGVRPVDIEKDDIHKETQFKDIVAYLYLEISNNNSIVASMPVTKEILEKVGVSEETAWEIGIENVIERRVMVPLMPFGPILTPILDIGNDENNINGPVVVTINEGIKGASVILSDTTFDEISSKAGTDTFAILPSSIHEVIAYPLEYEIDVTDLANIVKQVNKDEVEPEDYLGDKVYVIAKNNGKWDVVETAG